MKRWIACILIAVLLGMTAGCFRPEEPDQTLPQDQVDDTHMTQMDGAETDATEPDPTQTVPLETEPVQTEPEVTLPASDRNSVQNYFSNLIGTRWCVSSDTPVTLWVDPLSSLQTVKALQSGDEVELLGWYYYFAKVSSDGDVGYVLCKYIEPVSGDLHYYTDALNTVEHAELYTYEMMEQDLLELTQQYPQSVQLDSIGSSSWGTDIPVIRIGNEDAEYHILIQAAIHGCEYITTWVVMTMMDYWVDYAMEDYADVCYHVIPMSNPDGVYTAQSGTLTDEQHRIYLSDLEHGYTTDGVEDYARNWKANGAGVDLNRNFPAGWELITARQQPSGRKYAGTEPFCAPEARALRDYTLSYDFDVTISYHTAGSVIYYDYGDNAAANAAATSLAWAVNEVNGYILLGSDTVDGAGYKDWALDALSIPSVTIELGYIHPVDPNLEFYSIFATQSNMMAVVADWARSYNQ